MTIQKQDWGEYVQYNIIHEHGSVALYLYPKMQECFGGTAYISSLYVFTRDRGRGFGKILLEEAVGVAKREGHKSVVLECDLKNTQREVLDWYLRSGYVIVGQYREERFTLEKILK